jgi:hypothetical protein
MIPTPLSHESSQIDARTMTILSCCIVPPPISGGGGGFESSGSMISVS